MHDLVTRAIAHANAYEDVRPLSCELLRSCVAEIEWLRQKSHDADSRIDRARTLLRVFWNRLLIGYVSTEHVNFAMATIEDELLGVPPRPRC